MGRPRRTGHTSASNFLNSSSFCFLYSSISRWASVRASFTRFVRSAFYKLLPLDDGADGLLGSTMDGDVHSLATEPFKSVYIDEIQVVMVGLTLLNDLLSFALSLLTELEQSVRRSYSFPVECQLTSRRVWIPAEF